MTTESEKAYVIFVDLNLTTPIKWRKGMKRGMRPGFSAAANFIMRETFWSIMYAEDATLLTISVEEDSK